MKVFTITFVRGNANTVEGAPPRHEWRWNMESRGRTVGASTEGYENRQACIDNCSSVTGFAFEKPAGAPASFEYVRKRA